MVLACVSGHMFGMPWSTMSVRAVMHMIIKVDKEFLEVNEANSFPWIRGDQEMHCSIAQKVQGHFQ